MEPTDRSDNLTTESVFKTKVFNDEMFEIGPSARGKTQLIPITGGHFEGPDIKGTVVPGGADRQLIRPDGVMRVEARHTLKTDDSTLISVVNKGLVHFQEDPVHVRTAPSFEAPVEKCDWLNKAIFVSTLKVSPPAEKCVLIGAYKVV